MTSSPRARRFDWPNLRLRILSAGALAPVAVVCFVMGGAPFLVLLSIVAALLALEWGRMAAAGRGSAATAGLIAVAVLVALFIAYSGWWRLGWSMLGCGGAAAALVARWTGWSQRSMDLAFGVLYLGAPSLALLWLRSGPAGLDWTLLLLCATWAADITAYAGGTLLRGPRLWPRFSPNKTWSGFAAGLVASVLAAAALSAVLHGGGGLTLWVACGVGLLTGVATMAGDLGESMLKRRFGVKDSGDLIPGHGGLLDRVDGLLVAVLAVTVCRLIASFGGRL